MINLVLRNTTDTIYGRGSVSRVAELVKQHGGTKVLLHHVSEDFIKPLVKEIQELLENAGIATVDLGGVVPNPRLSTVYEGIELCRREKVDFILAIGGGSSIDSSKAIAIGVPYDGDVWDFFTMKAIHKAALPVGVVSTFAATGSECTVGTVITKEDEQLKRGVEDDNNHVMIRPKFAILDPVLTFTAPPFQTASGTADIISHLCENYFSADPDNDFSDHLCEAGLKTAIKFGPMVLNTPDDYEARGALMFLSGYAINGYLKFGRHGDWNCHALEHEMGGEWDIPHGAGLAIVTPHWMRYIYKNHLSLFIKFATSVFGIPYDADDPEKTALAGISALEDVFFKKLCLPSNLRALGVPEEKMTDEILHKICNNIFYYGTDVVGDLHPLREPDFFTILKKCIWFKRKGERADD